MKKHFLIIALLFFTVNILPQQAESAPDSIEVSIVDSYITPDTPPVFQLSFFTSDSCKTKLVIEGKGEFIVSETFTDSHKKDMDITPLKIKTPSFNYYIICEKKDGTKQKSERYEAEMPVEKVVENNSNFLTTCLFGGVVFLIPTPVYVYSKDAGEKQLFGLSKELPIVSFYSGVEKYPVGYFSAEYSHIFHSDSKFTPKNTFRYGYKHIIPIPVFEYVSPGVSGFTNFKGFNGISPELSVGLFEVYHVFTVNLKYRFNFQPDVKNTQFHEISIGIFSSFFSLHL